MVPITFSTLVVIPEGMVMLFMAVSVNAKLPIEVTELGMVMAARLVQSLNAFSPIEVIDPGSVMLVSPLCPLNTPSMFVIVEDTVYAPFFPSGYQIIFVLFLSNKTPSTLEKALFAGSTLIAVMFGMS